MVWQKGPAVYKKHIVMNYVIIVMIQILKLTSYLVGSFSLSAFIEGVNSNKVLSNADEKLTVS